MIGTKKDLDILAHKDHARLLIISDSHGNYAVMEKIVKQFGKSCDALIFCGDGAADIAQLLYSADIDHSVKKALPSVIAFVQGNGDPSSYPVSMIKSIKVPEREILTVNEQKFMIVHGHRQGVDFGFDMLWFEMQEENCKTAFYGHTHIANEYQKGSYRFINPGSCSRPRGGQPPCCAIATVEKTFVDTAFLKMDRGENGETVFNLWNPTY